MSVLRGDVAIRIIEIISQMKCRWGIQIEEMGDWVEFGAADDLVSNRVKAIGVDGVTDQPNRVGRRAETQRAQCKLNRTGVIQAVLEVRRGMGEWVGVVGFSDYANMSYRGAGRGVRQMRPISNYWAPRAMCK